MAIEAGIRLTAKNETTKAFQEFERNGRKSASKVAQEFEVANRAMRNVGIALTGFSAAGSALIVKSTLLAARVETLGVVLNQVGKTAGFSSDQMADFEKGVRDMGITTQVARISLVRLIQANIDLKNASKLARTAQDAAVIAGINSSQAFERIVQGIQTLNPRILKTMGLTINLDQAYREYSKTMNIAVEDIDVVTKKQIAVNEVLEAGTRIVGSYEAAMDTAGKRMTSIARHAEEAQRAFGEAFLPAFVLVIDAATAAFKAFNSLNPAIQRTAAYSIAAGTAIAGLAGPLLILASQGPKIVGSMSAVGMTFFDLGANAAALGTKAGFATTKLAFMAPALGALATAAIAATAVVALAIAIGMLIQFASDLADKQKTLVEVANEHEKALRKAGKSFGFYDEEMRRVIRDVGRFNIDMRNFDRLMREGGEEAVAAALGIQFFGEQALDSMQKAETATDGWANALIGATDAEANAEAAAKGLADSNLVLIATQEELKRKMDDLSFVMGINMGQAFDEALERTTDLKDEQGKLIKKIDELRGREWLSDSAKEELRAAEIALIKTNEAIVNESREWEKNTAQIIFNMAARALQNADLDVQAAALAALGQSLGLIDPMAAAAMEQVGIFTQMLIDGEITLEEYNNLVWSLSRGLGSLRSRSIVVELEYQVSGSPGGGNLGSLFTPAEIAQGTSGGTPVIQTEGGATGLQHGGPFSGAALVGDPGPNAELVFGQGTVIPAKETKALLKSGLFDVKKFQGGGGFAFDSDTIAQITGSSEAFSFSQARQITQRTVSEARQASAASGGSTAPAATSVAAVVSSVEAVATAAAEETAAAIGQATAGLGITMLNMTRIQTEQFRAMIQDQQAASDRTNQLLENIEAAVKDQGTTFDMGKAVTEGLQTADFAS